MNSTNRRGPPVSFAEAAAGRGKSAAASASAALEEAARVLAARRRPRGHLGGWGERAARRVHPTAVALDAAGHLLGGPDELGYRSSRRRKVHREPRLADAGVGSAAAGRARAEELEIERLRAALADATAK